MLAALLSYPSGGEMEAGSLGAEASSVRGNSPRWQRCHVCSCLIQVRSHRSHTGDSSVINCLYPVKTTCENWTAGVTSGNEMLNPLFPSLPRYCLPSLWIILTESLLCAKLGMYYKHKNTNSCPYGAYIYLNKCKKNHRKFEPLITDDEIVYSENLRAFAKW